MMNTDFFLGGGVSAEACSYICGQIQIFIVDRILTLPLKQGTSILSRQMLSLTFIGRDLVDPLHSLKTIIMSRVYNYYIK